MTCAKSHRRKVRKAKARQRSGLPLRKWEIDRLSKDEEGKVEEIVPEEGSVRRAILGEEADA